MNRIESLFAASLCTVLLFGTGCDTEAETVGFQLDREEVVEMMVAAGEPDADELLEPADVLVSEDDAAAFPSLEECLVEYCWEDQPSNAYDGQCLAISNATHPFGMVGVCIIAELAPGCEPYMWMGAYCSTISGLE